MTDKHIPAIEIVKAMIENIDSAIKIERVKYDSDTMAAGISISGIWHGIL
ncbi:MAG: hypothetical protein HY957_03230 [Nitrospirae bacterium]|nr:hypothetical protein [Nitrospirota bacterium]